MSITYSIDSLTLVISDGGYLTDVRGSDGVNYCVPKAFAMLDGYTRTPTSAEQDGDTLHIYFSDATLHYTVTEHPYWITFTLDSMDGTADTIHMLRMRCSLAGTGEVLGSAFSDTIGFCVLADSLGPKVTAYSFGSGTQTDIQAIATAAGYSVSVMDLQFKDAHAIAHALDYTSSPSGEFGRDLWTDNYLFMSVAYAKRETALEILQNTHCNTLMLPATCWSTSAGSYPIHPSYFPGGLPTLKQTVDYFHSHGIKVGMHVWSSKVKATDPLATPIDEQRVYFVEDEDGELLWDDTVQGYVIDQTTTMIGTVADNIATVFNYCGFDMVYFDGLEDVDPSDEHFYSSNCQYQVISRITKRPLYHMGSGAYHGMIHSLARLGTKDIWNELSPPTLKAHVDAMVTYNQRLATNDIPGDFGWYFLPVDFDELEYMLGRAKALDIPYSFHANITQIETEAENYEEIITLYDDLVLSDELRSQMLEDGATYFVVDDDVIFSQELDLDYGVSGWIGEGDGGAIAVVWSDDGSDVDLPSHGTAFWANGSSAPKVASTRRLTIKFDTDVESAIELLSDFDEVDDDEDDDPTPTPSYSAGIHQTLWLAHNRCWSLLMKDKVLNLRFPGMGVIRRFSHERNYSAVDYPTPWGVNVRLEDELTNRLRGGSFTPISAGARPSEILYRNRVLTFSSNVITATRWGDHDDTDMSPDISDTLRPTAFQLAQAGETGGTVVALVPHKDHYLVGFTATETWILQNDPLAGGKFRVSDEVGIIGADAWCVSHDTVYFLSSNGLYSVQADGSNLKSLSENKIPVELSGITDTTCTLTYNHSDRGVYIHLATGVSWFYDTERDQFWPFDDSGNSHVLIGPLHLGSSLEFALIRAIVGVMAAGSGAVEWRIVPGVTAEEACDHGKDAITADLAGGSYDEYVKGYGAWDAGRSKTSWPRVRCPWCCVWLTSSSTWAYESVVLATSPSFGGIR